jgi:signal transduction histidine kinase/DNA-binding NarL/FixJ family response regulator
MKRLLKKISTRFYLSLGLVSLVFSLMLLAFFFNLVPDRLTTAREGRAALAESIAVYSTALISRNDVDQLQSSLNFVVERNPDLLSAAIRTQDGRILAAFGDHAKHWTDLSVSHSTDTQVRVPIWASNQPWGQVELAFAPLQGSGLMGYLTDQRVQLMLFLAIGGFIVFYFYLGRMLRHLDPSRAVPERVRSALNTLAEGLLIMDTEGHVVLANQAFADLLSQDQDALTGQMAHSLPWQDAGGNKITVGDFPWEIALRQGTPLRNSMVWLIDGQDKRRSFLANCSPILTGAGEYGGVMVSLDDVTQLEEQEIELRKSKKEAETANQAKSVFLANMSHEIRSPMNAILGFTELLRRGQVKNETEYRRHLDIVHSSGKHLLELINDILDLSKVESGRLEVEHIGCSPYQILHEEVLAQSVKATEKRIAIDMECPGSIPAQIQSDPARLRQIVTNLVNNAVKFTDRGIVKVAIRFVAERPQARLLIEVSDTGIGIAENKLEKVFEPFMQAESSVTRRFGGTGLGLTISRRLARAMGGELSVKSVLGAGSTFTLSLPAGPIEHIKLITPEEAAGQQGGVSATPGSRWELPAVNVLIVDDGEENRELVRLVLEDAGAATEQAENGRIAVEKALSRHYDLILMDMQMPEMDGATATRLLRQRGLKTPIIALTAHAMKGFEDDIIGAGCTAHLTKPIDIDQLLSTIARLIGGKPIAASLNKPAVLPIHSTGHEELPSTPIVSRLAGNTRLQPAVDKFVARLDGQLTAVEQAWRTKDFAALADLAHWLKGAGGTVGFDAFTEPAKTLEQLAKTKQYEGVEDVVKVLRNISGRIAHPKDSISNAGRADHAQVNP